jgi:hypothetical protein
MFQILLVSRRHKDDFDTRESLITLYTSNYINRLLNILRLAGCQARGPPSVGTGNGAERRMR